MLKTKQNKEYLRIFIRKSLFPWPDWNFFFSSWFELFDKYGGPEEGKLKLKAPKQLQEVLDITRELLQEAKKGEEGSIRENPAKLMQMKSVLEMYV